MSQESLERVKLTPKQEKMLLVAKLPPIISVVKVARQLGIPPRIARELIENQSVVPVYRIGDGTHGGLMVDVDRLEELKDILLVRINDPNNPKPAVDKSAVQRKLEEEGSRTRRSEKLETKEDADNILRSLQEDSSDE